MYYAFLPSDFQALGQPILIFHLNGSSDLLAGLPAFSCAFLFNMAYKIVYEVILSWI